VKIVDRYVLRELAVPFLLGIGVFTSIMLIVRILKLVEMVVNRGVPFLEMLKLFSYILPAFLEITLPMALLLAILVAFGRMSSDSEIIALRASGFSLYRLLAPVGAFAFGAAVLTFFLSVYARPWGNSLLRTGIYDIVKARASAGIKPKVFNDDFAGLVLYVDRIEPPDRLYGILVSDQRDKGDDARAGDTATGGQVGIGGADAGGDVNTVYAHQGTIYNWPEEQHITLRLIDGGIYSAQRKGEGFENTTFRQLDINLDLRTALADLQSRKKDVSELGIGELRAAIAKADAAGDPAFAERVEWHRKLSIPFACLVFAAIGVPLGIQPTRSVHSRGFSVSLTLIFFYYLLLTLGQNLGERGTVHPLLAVWLPNLALSAVAGYLLRRSARDVTAGRPAWVGRLVAQMQRLRARTQPT
jgi:lipopolysaccharide export system permease protein